MNIQVCYDESDAAQNALNVAIEHAKAFDAKIFIVTSLVGGTKESTEESKEASERLEEAKSTIDKANLPCETHLLVRGLTPGEDIVKFADENDISEVIIGIKKTSKVGKLVFGSTAQHVILESNCPVVTVR